MLYMYMLYTYRLGLGLGWSGDLLRLTDFGVGVGAGFLALH